MRTTTREGGNIGITRMMMKYGNGGNGHTVHIQEGIGIMIEKHVRTDDERLSVIAGLIEIEEALEEEMEVLVMTTGTGVNVTGENEVPTTATTLEEDENGVVQGAINFCIPFIYIIMVDTRDTLSHVYYQYTTPIQVLSPYSILPTHCPNYDHQSQYTIKHKPSSHLKTIHCDIHIPCVHGSIDRFCVAMFLSGWLAHAGEMYHLV